MATILARHSPQRIVFGTDSPWTDQVNEMAEFKKLPLSDEGFELALSKNMAELLG
jgi:hypothetical protein